MALSRDGISQQLIGHEVGAKILVALYECGQKTTENKFCGPQDLYEMMVDKFGVMYKEDCLKDKLAHLKLKRLVEEHPADHEHPGTFSLTSEGTAWAKEILAASADGDVRFTRYVRRSTTAVVPPPHNRRTQRESTQAFA